MKKLTLIVFALLVTVFLAATTMHRDALFIEKTTLEQLKAKLEPQFRVFLPEALNGDSLAPVAILVHGCGGRKEADLERAKLMAEQGFIAISIDSMTPRGYSQQQVCDGTALHGHERTADVYLAIEFAKTIANADANNISLLGYSHGAWTLLEALHREGETMAAVSDDFKLALSGVKSVIAYYPYCGEAARFSYRNNGFQIPTLVYTAGLDRITPVEPCVAYLEKQQRLGSPIERVHFANVSHGFDMDESWVKHYDSAVAADAFDQQLIFISKHRGNQ